MQETLNRMLKEIGELKGEMHEGFKGVHRRQDIANGRTAKIEDEVQDLQRRNAFVDGQKKTTDKLHEQSALEKEIAPIIEDRRAKRWINDRIIRISKIVGAAVIIFGAGFDLYNVVTRLI